VGQETNVLSGGRML